MLTLSGCARKTDTGGRHKKLPTTIASKHPVDPAALRDVTCPYFAILHLWEERAERARWATARGARDQRWIRTRYLKYLGTKCSTALSVTIDRIDIDTGNDALSDALLELSHTRSRIFLPPTVPFSAFSYDCV